MDCPACPPSCRTPRVRLPISMVRTHCLCRRCFTDCRSATLRSSAVWAPPFIRRLHETPLHKATPATRVLHLVPNTPTPPPTRLYDKVVGHPSSPHIILDHTRGNSLRGGTFMPSPSPVAPPRTPAAKSSETKPPEWRAAPTSPRHVGITVDRGQSPAPAPLDPQPPPSPTTDARSGGRMVVRKRNSGHDADAEVERLRGQLSMSQDEVKRLQTLLGAFTKVLQAEVSAARGTRHEQPLLTLSLSTQTPNILHTHPTSARPRSILSPCGDAYMPVDGSRPRSHVHLPLPPLVCAGSQPRVRVLRRCGHVPSA